MAIRLTDKIVKELPAPALGNRVHYDDEIKGFGVRVTAAGAKAFVLNYRAGGRERRITIGSFPDWPVKGARDRAAELKRQVDVGADPMVRRHAERHAPTMNGLADLYREVHLPKKRPGSQQADETTLRLHVLPKLGRHRVADLRHTHIAALHREVTKKAGPIAANRTYALVHKLLSLAVKEGWIATNPATGIERNPENKRERFLTPTEIGRLTEALNAHPNKQSGNAVRLLLLTGARRGEVLGAAWSDFDLDAGVWTKPSHATMQKKTHRLPLSAPALRVLSDMRAGAATDHLFPGRTANEVQGNLKRFWATVTKAAGIEGARIHDLRHTHASILASSGLSLPVIGALLGHTQAQTTARYAHLLDAPLRAATERAGAVIMGAGKPGGDVVPLPAGRGRRA
jgi:integrase